MLRPLASALAGARTPDCRRAASAASAPVRNACRWHDTGGPSCWAAGDRVRPRSPARRFRRPARMPCAAAAARRLSPQGPCQPPQPEADRRPKHDGGDQQHHEAREWRPPSIGGPAPRRPICIAHHEFKLLRWPSRVPAPRALRVKHRAVGSSHRRAKLRGSACRQPGYTVRQDLIDAEITIQSAALRMAVLTCRVRRRLQRGTPIARDAKKRLSGGSRSTAAMPSRRARRTGGRREVNSRSSAWVAPSMIRLSGRRAAW